MEILRRAAFGGLLRMTTFANLRWLAQDADTRRIRRLDEG